MKRSVNICAGDKPLRSNIFVNTKVLPHMATVIKARKCARYFLSIHYNFSPSLTDGQSVALQSHFLTFSLSHLLTAIDDDKSFVIGINLLPRQIVVRA